MNVGDGVAFTLTLGQAFRRREVEAFVHQRLDEMGGKAGMDRVVARALVLEERLPVLYVPFREAPAVFRMLLVAVADGVAVVDRERRTAVVLVALVLVVAHHDQSIDLGVGERLRHMLDRGARDVLARDEVLGRHHMGELGIGLLQQVAIGD